MYHSIIFGEAETWDNPNSVRKNTYDDWHLVSTTRPYFVPPTPKLKTVDVPGRNGIIDMSTALTGYPIFNNREGSFEFTILNDYEGSWYRIYTEMMEFLGGKLMRCYLEDDPNYFYEGRFYVEKYQPGNSQNSPYAKITVRYNVEAHKWNVFDTQQDWLWDVFSFYDGVIFKKVFTLNCDNANNYKEFTFTDKDFGFIPTYPILIFEPNINVDPEGLLKLRFVNEKINIDTERTIAEGETRAPDFVMYGDEIKLYTKGVGTLKLKLRTGRL